jgi:hypothetical protein
VFVINREWLYIHIPKTSGTNLKELFLNSDNHIFENVYITNKAYDYWWNNLTLNRDVALLKESYPILSKHIPLSIYEKVFNCSKLKIFSIVRNPYAWAVSSYHEILKAFSSDFFPEFNRTLSFKEVFDYKYFLDLQPSFPINLFANQCDFLTNSDGQIKYDRIYKIEDDLQQLGNDFNLKNILTTKTNVGNYVKDYSKYYDDEMIEKVKQIYKKDFETFNYSKDPFWI